jgi:hypothetical protein
MAPRAPIAATLCRWAAVVTLLWPTGALSQEEGGEQEEVGISDNSFLIEEAYNQQQGVVQHIFNFVPDWDRGRVRQRTFDFVFTQEWPILSQRHQLSYTIPMQAFRAWAPGEPAIDGRGWGDVMLNYRCQACGGKDEELSFAPRFSLIFPTGEDERGFGRGKLGYQVNLPLSKQFEHWATHFNAGLTAIPGVTAGVDPQLPFAGRAINGYNLGGSVIRFVRPNLHLMLEALVIWDEQLTLDGHTDELVQTFLSPGIRWAPYTEGDTQWVVGLGVPIGISRDAPDIAAFFYMSFEHRFQKKREPAAD